MPNRRYLRYLPIFDAYADSIFTQIIPGSVSVNSSEYMNKNIKFGTNQVEFYATLSQRVNQYFKTNNICRNANREMVIKTVFMLSLYLVPYFISLTGIVTSYPVYLMIWTLMGLGTAGIGLSIMHDANHGSYSTKPWINEMMSYSLHLLGATSFNWKVQHNVLHHTYTNIYEVDEDISPRGALRMAPDSPWKPFHRFQYIYAWFLYGLMTLVWVVVKDIFRLIRYQKDGMIKKQKANPSSQWAILIATKVIYITYVIVIPALILPFSLGQILIGWLLMHYIAGFILAVVFQPAHVIEGTEYFMPDENGDLENTWAIHQLHTTTNYAHRNRILSWYVGGLNFQVEHHLFPNICHVHYRHLSKIVKSTAEEFGVPYKMKETFWDAMQAHTRLLKQLGERVYVPSSTPARVTAAAA
jgi:linoleoyl-CoA desaturase